MPWYGLNFRGDPGFAADPAGTVPVYISDALGTVRSGQTFGYVTLAGLDARNRNASIDGRIASFHFRPASGRVFRWNLPEGPGTYKLRVLCGDNDAGWPNRVVVKDGAGGTTLATINGTTATGRWMDATGATTITAANVAANAFGDITITFTSGVAEFTFGDGSSDPHTVIAHLALQPTAVVGPGTLNFQAAGMEFGSRSGVEISTFGLESGKSYRYQVYDDTLTLGTPIYSIAATNLDAAGKFPSVSDLAFTPGNRYRVVAIRQSDGEACIFRMVAT